jgi:hypothetical protein
MLQALQRDALILKNSQKTKPDNPTLPPPSQAQITKASELETASLPVRSKEISQATTPYSRQEFRNRQILLNKVNNYWIKGVLETSLHGKALIELGLEKRLDAGKTTTLLELARDLISLAEPDINQPIPVVFNLSAWTNEKQTLADWLVQELNTKYQVSQQIGQAWIKAERLLLLLDGLDEVSLERREACVQALNAFIQSHGTTEIVVCSRIKDYEALNHRLRFQGAIFIQPLTLEQVHHYLASTGSELAAINTALQADTILQELAKSPLMLSIITLAYQGMSLTNLPGMNLEERRQHLFDNYIQRMFDRRSANCLYSKEQSMQWLIWLAQRLTQQSQTVFLLNGCNLVGCTKIGKSGFTN